MQTMARPPLSAETATRPGLSVRRVGYGLAIAVNAVMLYVVHNLLAWGFPTFLTDEWELVLPVLTASIVVTIGANLALIAYDARWFRLATNAVSGAFGLAVVLRMRAVFPFGFESGTWETIGRWTLVVIAVAIGVGIITDATRAVRALSRSAAS